MGSSPAPVHRIDNNRHGRTDRFEHSSVGRDTPGKEISLRMVDSAFVQMRLTVAESVAKAKKRRKRKTKKVELKQRLKEKLKLRIKRPRKKLEREEQTETQNVRQTCVATAQSGVESVGCSAALAVPPVAVSRLPAAPTAVGLPVAAVAMRARVAPRVQAAAASPRVVGDGPFAVVDFPSTSLADAV